MPDVSYPHQFRYPVGGDGRSYPGLLLQVRTPQNQEERIEVQAHLDTGAEYSLFDGGIATALGLALADGPIRRFNFTSGAELTARRFQILLLHDDLGEFQLEVAFSLEPIRRNLLGRDFLDLLQVGFREHRLEFYVSPEQ